MSESNTGAAKGRVVAEKPQWTAPRILSREPLEAVAAVCAPSPPAKSNPGLCAAGPISS